MRSEEEQKDADSRHGEASSKGGEDKRESLRRWHTGIQMRKGLVAVGSTSTATLADLGHCADSSNLGLEMVPAEQQTSTHPRWSGT